MVAVEALGTSRRTAYRDRSSIRSQDDTSKKAWGGRRNSSLSIEEEQEFRYEYAAVSPWDGVASTL
jgi:hypothetical protein